MTYLLQPADVCWFAPVKKALKKEWDDWYINDTNLHTYTAANNMRLVCYCNVILSYLQTSNYQILIKVTRLFKMSWMAQQDMAGHKFNNDQRKFHSLWRQEAW